jgi:transposase
VTDFLQDHPCGWIVSLDEMSLYFQATTTRVWSPVGQTPRVWVTPQRRCQHFYGALNLRTGQDIVLPLPAQTAEMTCHFLSHLLACLPQQPILLLWDRVPWHRGAALGRWLADHPRLQFVYFPPACPDLNPQEHVWELTRDAVSHNHSRTDFGDLCAAFLRHLDSTLFPIDWLSRYAPSVLYEL